MQKPQTTVGPADGTPRPRVLTEIPFLCKKPRRPRERASLRTGESWLRAAQARAWGRAERRAPVRRLWLQAPYWTPPDAPGCPRGCEQSGQTEKNETWRGGVGPPCSSKLPRQAVSDAGRRGTEAPGTVRSRTFPGAPCSTSAQAPASGSPALAPPALPRGKQRPAGRRPGGGLVLSPHRICRPISERPCARHGPLASVHTFFHTVAACSAAALDTRCE